MFWFTLMLSPTNSLFFLVRSARRHSQKIDLLYLQLYFEELRSDKLSHKHDSNKYQSKAFLICDHRSDKYRSATHVNKTYLVWLWGLLRANVSFSTLQPPAPLFLFLLPSLLSRRTNAESLATQASHHKASSREHGKSQEFHLGSEKACGHLCRDSWKFPEILGKKKNSKFPLKAEFSRIGLVHTTGSPSSKYEHRRPSALLRNIRSIRICAGKKKNIVSVTYENERISLKNSLPYLKCVSRLSCVVHGPIYGHFMVFFVNGLLFI